MIELDDVTPTAPFAERHSRTIDRPIEEVWPAALGVTAREVRTLGPLMGLRSLPKMLLGKRTELSEGRGTLLDEFVGSGFVLVRQDAAPIDGRAVVLFGAAGKFWSVAHNAPRSFASAGEFVDFDEAGWAKTVATLEARDLGNGRTEVSTVTRVVGTDDASTKRFRPYWTLIRPFSGLIRISWLAAIERRANRSR